MCGIAAILRLSERPLPHEGALHRMLAAIAHRGPDDHGTFANDDVQLGAVRLEVVDLVGGHQPVKGCASSMIACVYNGETYNRRELHEELSARGHTIGDRCDTTLLPHLYEEHGDDMVERLRGMFAFALWDGAKRRLLLARDRLGIKPLYYAATPDYLVVASEAKALFASGLVTAAIDRDALDDLFSLGYPCPPRTMFAGVVELRPGHVVGAKAWRGLEMPRRYWRAPFPHLGGHRQGSAPDLAHELRDALRDAMRGHLLADVPIASCLSGGLDSSAIAALAKEVSGTAPTTFSIGFDDPVYDESAHARVMSRHLGGPSHEVKADVRAAELLPEMIWNLELPLLVPGAIGGLLLSERERAHGMPVALTGDGADELLGGYDCFRAAKVRRALDRPLLRALRPFVFRAAAKWAGQPEGLVDVVDRGSPDPDEIVRAYGGVYPPWYGAWELLNLDRAALLSPDGRAVRPTREAPTGFRALVRDDVASLDPLDAELALELETRLPSWILVISDRSAMANGVEARVPFLDHRVVELIASLPPSMKMQGMREKAILRDAVADLLPPAIAKRKKQPFMTPIEAWFFGAERPTFVDEALSPSALRDAGLFAPDVVARMRAELSVAPRGHVTHLRLELILMLVLGTQLLHRMFVADFRPDEHAKFHADFT